MAVDADKDQLSDLAESSDEEAGAAAVGSDEEQDAFDAINAAADEASDSDGILHRLIASSSTSAYSSSVHMCKLLLQQAIQQAF